MLEQHADTVGAAFGKRGAEGTREHNVVTEILAIEESGVSFELACLVS